MSDKQTNHQLYHCAYCGCDDAQEHHSVNDCLHLSNAARVAAEKACAGYQTAFQRLWEARCDEWSEDVMGIVAEYRNNSPEWVGLGYIPKADLDKAEKACAARLDALQFLHAKHFNHPASCRCESCVTYCDALSAYVGSKYVPKAALHSILRDTILPILGEVVSGQHMGCEHVSYQSINYHKKVPPCGTCLPCRAAAAAEEIQKALEPTTAAKVILPTVPPATEEVDGVSEEVVQQAIEVIRTTGRAYCSLLQRRLRIGYTRSARIMDILEERGIVGPHNGAESRDILIAIESATETKQ